MEILNKPPSSDAVHRAIPSDTVDLREVLAKFWARKHLIIACILVCGGLSFVFAKQSTPVYTSAALVMIKTKQTSAPTDPGIQTMIEGSPEVVPTQAFILQSRILARETVEHLRLDRDPEFNPLLLKPYPWALFAPAAAPHGKVRHIPLSTTADKPSTAVVDEFMKRLSVTVEEHSNVIRVSFSSMSPVIAAQVPNTLIALYLKHQISASLISPAAVPLKPIYPNDKTIVMVGFIIGAGMGIVLAGMFDVLLGGLRSKQQVEEVLGIKCLALVPKRKWPHQNKWQAGALFLLALVPWFKRFCQNRFPFAEPHIAIGESAALRLCNDDFDQAVRSMQLKLRGCDPCSECQVLLVTSALPKEGKTWVAASLATSLSAEGFSVALIDCDLHRPAVHRMFNSAREPGVIDFFSGAAALDEIIRTDTGSGVDYVSAGSALSKAAWHVTADRLHALIDQLRERYKFVIIDSAPALAVPETAVLSQVAHKTLVVIRWGSTSPAIVRHALIQLSESGGSETAALLSMVDLKRAARYGDIIAHTYQRLTDYYGH